MPTNKNEWKNKLHPDVYYVCWEKGTEPPFSGRYFHHEDVGNYVCACCGNILFHSDDKFDSGTGWPSFSSAATDNSVRKQRDDSHNMIRVEACCNNCGAHLGHIFTDGPEPSGLRYCINSLSLEFQTDSNPVGTEGIDEK